MSDRDWIIAYDGTKGDMAYALECLRCGGIHRVGLPINMTMWLASAKAFTELHDGCKVRDTEQTENA